MDDAEYWKRRAEDAERELQKMKAEKRDEASGPRCSYCGRGKAVYGRYCSACAADMDL